MEIKIEEKSFIDLKGINSIKSYASRIKDYKVGNNELNGVILLDLNIFDKDNNDIFISKEIPITIILAEERNIKNILIDKMDLEVIESWGLNAYYSLTIHFEDEIVVENEKTREENDDSLEETLITKERDDESITSIEDNNEEESNVEIICTKSHLDEKGFLSFFDSFLDNTFSLKTIRVNDESELNNLSIEYNIKIEDVYKGYDKERGIVLLKIND